MKKVFVMPIAVASVLCLASIVCAETITRIAGSRITVRDSRGNEKTIEGTAKGFKVGDKVKLMVRDGRTWLDPQPEPPSPRQIKPTSLDRSTLQKKVHASPEAPPPPPPPDRPKLK
jgi:hypothetical protein